MLLRGGQAASFNSRFYRDPEALDLVIRKLLCANEEIFSGTHADALQSSFPDSRRFRRATTGFKNLRGDFSELEEF
jgi:hypothetical protein